MAQELAAEVALGAPELRGQEEGLAELVGVVAAQLPPEVVEH